MAARIAIMMSLAAWLTPTAAEAACTPYAPQSGSFYNTVSPKGIGSTDTAIGDGYTLSQNSTNLTVTIKKNGATIATEYMSYGKFAQYYYFAKKYLILDIHTFPGELFVDFTPVLFDLSTTPVKRFQLDGLPSIPASQSPQLHINPSPDGQAFLFYYGETTATGGHYDYAKVIRSDTGQQLCSRGSYYSSGILTAAISGSTVHLWDGPSDLACPLPQGKLDILPQASIAFGTTSPSKPVTKSLTFKNIGNDCLVVSAISSTTHFGPTGFSPLQLTAGSSQSVSFVFDPKGALGSFPSETSLAVTATPASGDSAITVSGTSVISVSVSPGSPTVGTGGTVQFSVPPDSGPVTWSVLEGSAGGTVTSGGLYTAPLAAGTYHVVATSVQDPSKSATATVAVSAITISISPSSATVLSGETRQFIATVTNAIDSTVTWSVQEGVAGGTVTSGGLYTAPLTAGTYHVVATSVQEPTRSSVATIVVPPVAVSVAPSTKTMSAGLTTQFTANVTNAIDTAVTWSVQEGAAGGTVNSSGMYAAPYAAGTYHVVATSVQDPTRKATASVTVTVSSLPVSRAEYSSILGAPFCSVVTHPAAGCDAEPALLAGKASTEQNAPNTLNASCTEESFGEGLSIRQIAVRTVDGTELGNGKRVQATIWVIPAMGDDMTDPCPDCDQLDVYYNPDHDNVTRANAWEYLTTLQYPTSSAWMSTEPQALIVEFTMGTGSRHALRANFRNTSQYLYGWNTLNPSNCSRGSSDHDDLVFYVATDPVPVCSRDMSSDPNNCGACGVVCAKPHASSGCWNGACWYSSCSAGWYNCNGTWTDGCESSDPYCGEGPPTECLEDMMSCVSDSDCCSGFCSRWHTCE